MTLLHRSLATPPLAVDLVLLDVLADPGSRRHVVAEAFVAGSTDEGDVCEAWRLVATALPVLRQRLAVAPDEAPENEIRHAIEPLVDWLPSAPAQELTEGVTWRVAVTAVTEQGVRLRLTHHAALLDERSRLAVFQVFADALSAVRAGRPWTLAATVAHSADAGKAADVSDARSASVSDAAFEAGAAEAFWRARLGEAAVTRVWGAEAAALASADAAVERPLPPDLLERILATARRLGVSPESFVEAVTALVLGRAAGTAAVRFAVRRAEPAFAPREVPARLGVLDLVRVAVLDLMVAPTLAELARQVEVRHAEALPHIWAPLSQVARWDAGTRGPSRRVADLLLTVDLDTETGRHRDSLEVRTEREPTGFPLTLTLRASAAPVVSAEFDSKVIAPAMVRGLLDAVSHVLEQVAANPDLPLDTIRLAEPDAPMWGSSSMDRGVSIPIASTAWFGGIAAVFTAQAAAAPNATAIVCGDETLSTLDLDARAALIGGHLRAAGVSRGDIVALHLERGSELAAAVLGILRAGAAWLPLDPAYPRGRTLDVLRRSGARCVLTQRALAGVLAEAGVPELLLEDAPSAEPLAPLEMSPDEPAYLIYTSGSTGTPKGVLVSHGNVVRYARALGEVVGLEPTDRWLHTASMAFSSSVRQLLVPLLNGATVVIARRAEVADPRELLRVARQARITIMDLVPSYWARVVEALEAEPALAVPSLRLALSASEPLPAAVLERWLRLAPAGQRFINMFGQTETTGIVAAGEVTLEDCRDGAILPLGRALPGNRLLVLDAAGQPLPAGLTGEIVVSGSNVGLGYLGDPELTAARFRPDPFHGNGARLYATGDRGYVRPDGRLAFVGRQDNQVKVRGHRVEVEEVEAVLTRHAGVSEAAVDVRLDAGGDVRLVAFVVPAVAGEAPAARELRDHLAATLPEYMMPAAFTPSVALPRTPNGKLDRGALRALAVDFAPIAPSYVAPRTPLESELSALWCEVLGVSRVGVSDHFFEIGGHSLMAIRVLARIRATHGVDLPVRVLFERPTVAALAEEISARLAGASAEVPLRPLADGAEAPLSFAEERLWVLHQMEPESAAYNLVAAFRIHGRLDREALVAALSSIERRHQSLRTVFPSPDGMARAEVRPPRTFPLPVERVASGESRDESLRARAAELAAVPFDLAEGPLFRGTLLEADTSDHLLVLVMHHVISDGWSRGVLYRELGEAYALFATGRPDDRPELAIQYRDYAAWQRARLTEGVIEAQSAYWSRQLAGPLPTLDLPTDRPRPPVQTYKGATHSFLIPPRLAERLRELGAAEDATSFMVLLAAFQALLGRYSGQDDVVVGSPTAGRTRVETEPLIGFFVNTLALRADLSGNPSFRSLLARVRRMALDAFEHQDLPFERLVESLKLPRDLSRSPLFQVLFILQNTPVHPLTLPGLTLQQVDVDAGAAKFDVTLALVNADGGYTGHLEYNTDLFDASTVERLAGHYVRLLEAAAEAPDRPIGRLALLTSPEREQLLHAWNATDVELPTGDTIVSQFEAQVARTPDAPAATFELETLSYGELNARVNRLAAHLRALGVGPDTLVGMLAAMKAGGAYLPLDPAYPDDRIAFMLEDSGAPVVLTQARLMSKLPAREGVQVVRVDADAATFAARPVENPAPTAGPAHLAYQIYTSGSTGRPKGVMIEHRNVINFFVGMDERVGGDAPGTWLAVTSISFDISVLELLFTLTRGYHVIVQGDPERVRQQQAVKRSDRKLGFSIFYWGSDAHAATENRYRMLLDGAKFADANGFEAVWVPERHFHSFGGLYPSPAVASAAIAAATCRIKLRSGSVVLPLHSPVRVAEDWSVVDNLSNGRVGLGFASGWHDRDFVFAPDNYANRRQVLTDYIDIVRRLWRGETVTLPGGSGTPVQIATLPRPIQPELPVWVTAAGTPSTYEMAGTTGANVLTHLLGQTPETLREKIALYRAARKRAGHEGPGHVTLMLHTYVHEDMEHVKRTVWHPFREYLRTSVDLIKGLAEGRGQDMRSAEFTAEDMEALLDHAFHRYFDTSALLGTPETCSEMVERLKGMDVDEIACLIDFGIPDSETMGSLELLAELRRRSDESSATASADFDIKAQLERWNVTHFQCTPSMAAMLTQEPETRSALAGLQCLMVGGEAFPTALAGELQALVRGRVVNMYGPTETTIWSATHTLDGAAGAVPLGTPIANTVCHVVDRNLELVPVGVPGELLIGGDGVVRGYHARPELTAERFLLDPFLGRGRVYRTGDLVRWRADGRLEFLGRIDHQVKVRGHRIELGEIETALEAEASVREAVVMVRSFGADDNRLVAYVVPSRGTVDAGALRQALGARLPEYMVPQHVVPMERLPRTPNLKVDRKALPAPNEVAAAPTATFVQPGSELESQIAAIWRDVLQLPQVGVSDNFFDIGGHSLLTVKVHMRLRGAIDKPVSITDLFRFPTIRSLAEHLGGAAPAAPTGEKAQARADARREALQNRRARRGTS
jgi:natural product biosynthesis luciferase-like monooxygenase protein/amino acid adenylation domain-containing protein